MADERFLWPFRRRRGEFTLKGWHVAAIFGGFFLVVAGVNAVMVTSALRTMPGLDARNGYDVSQTYNQRIAAAEAQAARRLRAELTVRPEGKGAFVEFAIHDADGRPVAGLQTTARLQHPASRAADVDLSLREVSPGHYAAMSADLPSRAWTIVVEAKTGPEEPPVFVTRNRIALAP